MSIRDDIKRVRDTTTNAVVKKHMENVLRAMDDYYLEIKGELFTAHCSCGCGELVKAGGVALLGTGLAFASEAHMNIKAYYITGVRGECTVN